MAKTKGKNSINIIFISLMATFFIFIATRGLSANLNQKNLSLTKEVSELVSTNQWIKYQISDKISLDKIAVHARTKLNMVDITNKDIKYLSVDLNYINAIKQMELEKNWLDKLQKNVRDIFDGQ